MLNYSESRSQLSTGFQVYLLIYTHMHYVCTYTPIYYVHTYVHVCILCGYIHIMYTCIHTHGRVTKTSFSVNSLLKSHIPTTGRAGPGRGRKAGTPPGPPTWCQEPTALGRPRWPPQHVSRTEARSRGGTRPQARCYGRRAGCVRARCYGRRTGCVWARCYGRRTGCVLFNLCHAACPYFQNPDGKSDTCFHSRVEIFAHNLLSFKSRN